jgi:hypothetical protein
MHNTRTKVNVTMNTRPHMYSENLTIVAKMNMAEHSQIAISAQLRGAHFLLVSVLF